MMNNNVKTLKFKVFRFNAETDYLPVYKTYELEVNGNELMLDVLDKIKWTKDGSFSYRRSCRHGICGSCAIKVNGKSIIACKDNVFELAEMFGSDELVIEPSRKERAIKDMIIDKSDFWAKYDTVKPYLVADIDEHPAAENRVTPDDAEKINGADHCIQCGVCYYACPAVEVNPDFIGPAALAKAARFTTDVRDTAKRERLSIVNELGSGIWDCVKCFECATACPKHVDPIGKITVLHNQTFEENMAEDNVATRHAVGFKDSARRHGLLDETEIVRYSEGTLGMVKHIGVGLSMMKVGKVVMPWEMHKSKNIEEIRTLIKSSSTTKFKGK
jgi:succinate dehydrogenase / fumarate reductase iron-sulfur subunit